MNAAIIKVAYDTKYWEEFLELYKSFPSLWNRKSSQYANRIIKAESYIKMVEKLQEIDPAANREMVIKKINSFRTTYRFESKEAKYINRKLSGTGKSYKSSWHYFDLLSFLDNQQGPLEGNISSDECKSLNSENTNPSILAKKNKVLKKVKKKTNDETLKKKGCEHLNEINDKKKIGYNKNQNKKILKKVKKQTNDETSVKIGCDHLNEINDKTKKVDYENQKEDNNDEAKILAKGWTAQYGQLSNKQKLLSKKIISNVLLHGCLNHLTENTVQEINNILDSQNWNNDYSMESEVKIEMEDYRIQSQVKIEKEDYCMQSEIKCEMEDYIE